MVAPVTPRIQKYVLLLEGYKPNQVNELLVAQKVYQELGNGVRAQRVQVDERDIFLREQDGDVIREIPLTIVHLELIMSS